MDVATAVDTLSMFFENPKVALMMLLPQLMSQLFGQVCKFLFVLLMAFFTNVLFFRLMERILPERLTEASRQSRKSSSDSEKTNSIPSTPRESNKSSISNERDSTSSSTPQSSTADEPANAPESSTTESAEEVKPAADDAEDTPA